MQGQACPLTERGNPVAAMVLCLNKRLFFGTLTVMTMPFNISHDRSEETAESKTRWFRSLPMSDRMELLCSFTDLVLSANPKLQEQKRAQSIAGRIQVVSAT